MSRGTPPRVEVVKLLSIRWVAGHRGMAFTLKYKGNENLLIGMCLSFQGQLDEIYPHSVSDLRAL
jgi:hypothetical protein